jgi:hypothetical protein
MWGFDEAKEKRDDVYDGGEQHKAAFSHELIGGAAAFEAMKVFEDHQRKEGKTVNHSFAKEMIAGFAGAEVDKLFETKGLDFLDKEQAKRHAKQQADHLYDSQYSGQDQYDPNNGDAHPSMQY